MIDGRYLIYVHNKLLLDDPFWASQEEFQIGQGNEWTEDDVVTYTSDITIKPKRCKIGEPFLLEGNFYLQRVADEKVLLIQKWGYNAENGSIKLAMPLWREKVDFFIDDEEVKSHIRDALIFGVSDMDLLQKYHLLEPYTEEYEQPTEPTEPSLMEKIMYFLQENNNDDNT